MKRRRETESQGSDIAPGKAQIPKPGTTQPAKAAKGASSGANKRLKEGITIPPPLAPPGRAVPTRPLVLKYGKPVREVRACSLLIYCRATMYLHRHPTNRKTTMIPARPIRALLLLGRLRPRTP